MLFGDYNIPINQPAAFDGDGEISADDVPAGTAESLSFGAAYRFWGIFFVGGHFYNEIIYGADNIFNVQEIRPLGLFSAGLGLEVPLGDIGLIFDWQRMFTGSTAPTGLADFSNSFKWGLTFKVSDRFAIEAYARRFSNFTDRVQVENDIYAESGTLRTFGAGAVLRLF